MAKTFLEIQTECALLWHNKAFSSLTTGEQTSLKLRINLAQQAIVTWPRQLGGMWPWLKDTGYFTLTVSYTDGTIDLTQYSKTVTGTGTTFTGMADMLLIVDSGTEPYRIDSITNATELELETPFIQTTATEQDYTIVQDRITLASDFMSIIKNSVKIDGDVPLTYMPEAEYDDTFSNSVQIGSPTYYGLHGRSSTGLAYMLLREGYPEYAKGGQYKYYKSLAALTDDATISLICYMLGGDNALIFTSIYYMMLSEMDGADPNQLGQAKSDSDTAINQMWLATKSETEDEEITLLPNAEYIQVV